jgi:hypothetical protein
MHVHRIGWVITLGWAAASSSPLALAALGGDLASVQSDAVTLKAQARAGAPGAAAASAYTVQELTTQMGTVVREYANPSGKVFAVTWRGPQMPNLSQLLGPHVQELEKAAAAPHQGHRHLTVNQPDLVISSNGHMRAFYGRAYIPSLTPAGVAIGELP